MRQHDDLFRTWERAMFWINHQNHLWVNVKSNPNQIQMLLSHRSSDQPFELAEWPGWRKENLAYTLMIAFFFSGIFAFFSNSCLFSPIPPQKFPTFPILCCSERVLFSAHTHALSDHINVPTNRPIPPVIAPEFFLYFAGFFPREKSGKNPVKPGKNPIFFPGGTGFFLRHFAWSFLCTSASWEFIFSKTTLVRPLWANLIFSSNWGNLEISQDPWSIATGQDTCCNMQEDIYNSNIPHLCAWHNCPFSSIHLGLCQVIL